MELTHSPRQAKPTQAMYRHVPVFQAKMLPVRAYSKLGEGDLPFKCHGNGIQQRTKPIPENREKTQLG